MSAGKGDTRRPAAVTDAVVAARWRATFGRVTEEVKSQPYRCPNTRDRTCAKDCAQCAIQREVNAAQCAAIDAKLRRLANDDQA